MRTEPQDLDRADLVEALDAGWGISPTTVDYLPVGFGSQHWVARGDNDATWFVTVDDLGGERVGGERQTAFAVLRSAFETATYLRRGLGLDFVVAPVPDQDGEVIRRMAGHYSIAVFDHLDGAAVGAGGYPSAEARREVLRLVGSLHAATVDVEIGVAQREDFVLPSREPFLRALAALDTPWESGPYAEPARQLLRESAAGVRALMDRYDDLVAEVSDHPPSWVIAHGEPHSANLLRDQGGSLRLIDWDTVKRAPRERDLWMLLADDPAERALDLAAYSETAGPVTVLESALRLYRTWWDLSEICGFTAWMHRDHSATEDLKVAWESLRGYLAGV